MNRSNISAHHAKLTWSYHGVFTEQLSAQNLGRTIEHKFQVKKSLNQWPPETRKKCSAFSPFSSSFSKPLLMVARKRVSAERGLCSGINEAVFIFQFHTLDQGLVYSVKPKFTFWISQWTAGIWFGNWKHREKAKLEGPVGQTTRENGLCQGE